MANNNPIGRQFLTNIKYQNSINNYVWSIAESNRNTLLLASRTGIIEYNHEKWNTISVPDISLSLLKSRLNDKIYACGRNHIGYLMQNEFRQYAYYAIDESYKLKGIFTDIFETDSGVYFYSTKELVHYNPVENSLSTISGVDSTATLLGSFVHNNKLYVNILNQGAFEVSNNAIVAAKGLEKLNNRSIAFSCMFDAFSTLIGTRNGQLFLLNSEGIELFHIEDEEYLQKGIISDGVLLAENQLAISFKNLGLIVIDKSTRKTTDIVDRESGLPDDFVMSLFTDRDKTLWMAHASGISSIDVSLPIKSYSSYPGIEGSIITSNFWKRKFYVATSDGVFLLDSISKFDTREAYKKIPIVNNVSNEQPILVDNTDLPEDTLIESSRSSGKKQKKDRKGIFKRLFTNKETPETELSEPKKPTSSKPTAETGIQKQQFEYFQYQQFVLKSKHFGFSLLGELKERCTELNPMEDQLLAVTNSTIYSIDTNKNVSKIFSGSKILDVVLSKSNDKKIFVIDKAGVFEGTWEENKWRFTLKTESDIDFNITSLAELSEQSFLISLNNQLVEVNAKTGEITEIPLVNPYSENIIIKQVNEEVFVLVGTKLHSVGKKANNSVKLDLVKGISVARPFLKQPNHFWIKSTDNTYRYFGISQMPEKIQSALKVFDDINDIHIDHENNLWIIDNSDEIYRLNTTDFNNYKLPCEVYLGKIYTADGIPISGDEFELKYAENSLMFSFASPSVLKLNSTQYQYKIEGLMEAWSEWNNNNEFAVPYFPAGNYHLKFRAKNIFDEISEVKGIRFKVLPPIWKTFYFYALLIIILVMGFYFWQKFRLKRLIKEKENLQQKVKERTKELQIKNESITDSINYASKIQKALLPPKEKLDSLLNDYFVFYKPKDIISGDFYLTARRKRYTVIIAADSTGHGVPGAFMSMLGMAYINELLSAADSSLTAADILNKLRDKIITLLHQHNSDSRDGMDMVVLLFDRKKNNLQYAGAHNPLYRLIPKKYPLSEADANFLTDENDHFYLLQYKGDKFQVGNSKKAHIDFTNHKIEYEPSERLYIFSDGYADQFGGEKERKFMYGNFRKLILSNAHKSMKDQKIVLKETIEEWKNGYPQTDDILVFGLKP